MSNRNTRKVDRLLGFVVAAVRQGDEGDDGPAGNVVVVVVVVG